MSVPDVIWTPFPGGGASAYDVVRRKVSSS